MKWYLADLRILLEGCFGRLAAAFALFAGSAALDLVCMALLPVFVIVALSPDFTGRLPAPWLDAAFGPVSAPAFSAAIVALFALRAAFMLVVGASMAQVAESVRERIVTRLVGQLLNGPYEAAIRRSMSDEIAVAFHHSIGFSQSVVLPLLRLALDILTMIVVLAFVASLEPQAVLAAAAVFGAVGFAYLAVIRGTTARASRWRTDLQTELYRLLGQAFSSPREVRVYRLQPYFAAQIADNLRANTRVQARLGAVYWFPRALGELTLIALAIAYMVLKARSGAQAALVVSNLSVLAFAGLRTLPAFAQSMANLSYVQSGRRATRLLADRLRGTPDAPALSHAAHVRAAAEPGGSLLSLELERVSFRYAGANADALRDISLCIRRGQSVGVVGPSGAGKSTLGDLLLGLLAPREGRILVNGRAERLDRAQWWRLAGFVPQSPYIADDTVLRNVAYGLPDGEIDLERVQRALRLAQLEQVVARLPQGLETRIGDQGVRLSGGQRQRVAIARALYHERDFLVLDEATSALDAETEQEVIRSIDALKGTITTFIIAHRTSTLQNCDFVIEMRDGQVAEIRAASPAA
jgi:ABC-type multidrug transport system fused ATPase/permease subunit